MNSCFEATGRLLIFSLGRNSKHYSYIHVRYMSSRLIYSTNIIIHHLIINTAPPTLANFNNFQKILQIYTYSNTKLNCKVGSKGAEASEKIKINQHGTCCTSCSTWSSLSSGSDVVNPDFPPLVKSHKEVRITCPLLARRGLLKDLITCSSS